MTSVTTAPARPASAKTDVTGLQQDDHIDALGSTWRPFEVCNDDTTTTTTMHDDGDKPVSGLLAGLKRLGDKMRGDKSHRFTDLLHLHGEVKRDLQDVALYPELANDAELRRNNALSDAETQFIRARKQRIADGDALRAFLRLDERERIHPDDVPVVALGGSGGGYRACLGFLAYIEEMQRTDAQGAAGLWDVLTFVAGVSGSCWTIAGLYSVAQMDAARLLDRFAASSAHHPLSMTAIDAVARSANGVYFQLAPILQKIRVGHLHPTPLDLYGTLITSHIFFAPEPVRHGDEKGPPVALQRDWFRFSNTFSANNLHQGAQPLPLLTAVRHERPWRDWKSAEEPFATSDQSAAEHTDAAHAWWQWFEVSPLEFGSDELEGWIPTWSFGRHFENGRSTQRLPERSLALLLGICTSAPAGPLAAWLATIYRNLPTGMLGSKIRHAADAWVEAHPRQAERLQSHHPVHAMNEANPFFHAEKQDDRGQGFENSPRIHLVDAGMSNNLPQYAFFRPGRDVDLMLLADFSSDVQTGAALERLQEFGRDKGVSITPRTPLDDLPPWPQEPDDKDKDETRKKTLSAEELRERFGQRYAQVLDVTPIAENDRDESQGPTHVDAHGVRYNQRHQPQATRAAKAIYMPLLPHACQPTYDPSTAPFSSSYNLVWTREQVECIRKTSRADLVDGVETIRSVLRDIYETKKAARLSSMSS